jgi:CRP-like cAMP-binding protein
MESTISLLKNYLQKLYPVSDADFERLSRLLFVKEFKARERLISENELEENLFFVVKGVLRKYFLRNKHEVITQFFVEADFANEVVSFFTGNPSQYFIEAIEPAVCYGINKNNLEKLLAEVPELEKLYRLILSKLYVKKELNEYNKARQTKQERFLSFCNEQTSLLQRVPQKYLASYLEIAPETFCRMKHVRYKAAKKGSMPDANNN